jgi:hypothetical protein
VEKHWEPISFFGAISFPSPRNSASLPVLQKNQLTSPFVIDLGKRKFNDQTNKDNESLSILLNYEIKTQVHKGRR